MEEGPGVGGEVDSGEEGDDEGSGQEKGAREVKLVRNIALSLFYRAPLRYVIRILILGDGGEE